MRQFLRLGSLRWYVCHPVQSLDDEEGTPALAAADGDAERIETWFDAGAWSEDLADSYLALCRVDEAVRMISDATRSGHAEGAEMLCEPAEKLMRSGYETLPGQGSCGSRLAPTTPTTSGSMCRLASGMATSATTPGPWNG